MILQRNGALEFRRFDSWMVLEEEGVLGEKIKRKSDGVNCFVFWDFMTVGGKSRRWQMARGSAILAVGWKTAPIDAPI